MTGGTSTLKVRDLTVAFGQVVAVRDISVTARQGETVAIFGANGSGKTTFLKAVAGLVPATRGKVAWRGEDVTALPAHERAARGMRYVSDRSRVATRMTVLENLEAGAWLLPASRWSAARERVFSLFPALAEKARAPAGVLSGGERQMLILDEIFSALSAADEEELMALLRAENRDGGTAFLLVSHNPPLLKSLCRRILVLGEGRIVRERTI